MAARTTNPEHKAALVQMAETWENLARDRKAFVERTSTSPLWKSEHD
jgi:hypothetical protein